MKTALIVSTFAAFTYLVAITVVTIWLVLASDESLAELSGTPNFTPGTIGFVRCIMLLTIVFMTVTLYKASRRPEFELPLSYMLIVAGTVMMTEFVWTLWRLIADGFAFLVPENVGRGIALGAIEIILAFFVFAVSGMAAAFARSS